MLVVPAVPTRNLRCCQLADVVGVRGHRDSYLGSIVLFAVMVVPILAGGVGPGDGPVVGVLILMFVTLVGVVAARQCHQREPRTQGIRR